MLFNSLDYAIFLPIVFILYWFVVNKQLRSQNLLLLTASYFFYGSWDYRFLFLLIFSTFLDYFTGLKMYRSKSEASKKTWFWLSIIINLGFLAVFKYYNFFITSISDTFTFFGYHFDTWTLKILLPVGISFYTFHGMSYVIDIYKGRIKPTTNFIEYSVFVSFFPLLVAGPIERATHLLPQIEKKRTFNYSKAADGMRQILWGLFKKIVIADNCAEYANLIFNNPAEYSGSSLVLGAIFFAFQIYGDFSGYSDIALGTARLFGIELLRNFAFPYFSRDIAEFWRRWHMSLTTWFRDYLYIPLGGSKGGLWMKVRNTFAIFLVSGFWHGANWTFLVWGALNAIYFLPLLLLNKNRSNIETVAQNRYLPSIRDFINMAATFMLTTFAWIFFRASSLTQAFVYLKGIFTRSLFTLPQVKPKVLIIFIVIFVIAEWIQRDKQHALEFVNTPKPLRWAAYYATIGAILVFGSFDSNEFIYFQF